MTVRDTFPVVGMRYGWTSVTVGKMRYGWTSVTVGDALHGARRRKVDKIHTSIL